MLFERLRSRETPAERRYYALMELAYTAVDFGAGAFFLIGSILFYFEAMQTVATTFFVIGSALFTVKPGIRIAREFRLAADGNASDLAKRERHQI
ncbi:MAG: YrhK family protein [Burkholderiaceae bacterium]